MNIFDELKEKIENCRDCELYQTRNRIVIGEGNPQARLLIIGEAPGANEDETGRPFVGKAGKFLDECLSACGLDRSLVFIANIMKCRPCIIEGKINKNRPPKTSETQACNKWLKAQIDIIKPSVILCLGAPANKFILDKKAVKMTEIRGHFFQTEYCDFVMPSLHPSYILTYKGEAEKQMLISDILACKEKILELGFSLTPGEIYREKSFDLFS